MSRIHDNFHYKNMPSTFVDIVSNMPENFHLDMPSRISDMTSWVQLSRNASFCKSLTSDVARSRRVEFMSLFRMEISRHLS